jgi:formyl-CoA transferase
VPQLSETSGVLNWTGPSKPGSHNSQVYAELLGLSDKDLERLAKAGVV